MSPAAIVNGDSSSSSPSSAFLSHLISYPLISDSLHHIQTNPLGSRTITLTQKTYSTTIQPLLPYLRTPYSYLSPYLTRADSLGDNTLSTLDSKFPIVKKPTGELYNDSKGLVFLPLVKGKEGKEYVFKTWDGEVKKVGDGGGLVGKGKAVIGTGLVVTSETLRWIGEFLGEKKKEAKEGMSEKL